MYQSKFLMVLVCMLLFSALQAQGITGVWTTIDDETNEPKSHIKIYEKDGKIYGRVIKLLPAATTDVCNDCPDGMDGKSLYDIDVVGNLEPYKDYYSYGYIVDPGNGKKYKCSVWREGNTLKVRGYLGVSLLGRTQIWHLLEE